jgi:hypothetical protein
VLFAWRLSPREGQRKAPGASRARA